MSKKEVSESRAMWVNKSGRVTAEATKRRLKEVADAKQKAEQEDPISYKFLYSCCCVWGLKLVPYVEVTLKSNSYFIKFTAHGKLCINISELFVSDTFSVIISKKLIQT